MVPTMSNKLKVLVIDREDRPADIWRKIADLADLDATLKVVGDVEIAQVDLAESSYDLIFCSYYFQTETGTEFMARMRERGVATPVIFIATTMDTKGVLDAAALPMADFLVAPFPTNDLKQRIRLLCGDLTAA